MRKIFIATAAVSVAVGAIMLATESSPAYARGNKNPLPQPVVYVYGQDLYYDSTVTWTLPAEGVFQKLESGGPHGGPQTEFGPGDTEYVGGRWWIDANGDDIMDEDDAYFLCPLLGPGRSEP